MAENSVIIKVGEKPIGVVPRILVGHTTLEVLRQRLSEDGILQDNYLFCFNGKVMNRKQDKLYRVDDILKDGNIEVSVTPVVCPESASLSTLDSKPLPSTSSKFTPTPPYSSTSSSSSAYQKDPFALTLDCRNKRFKTIQNYAQCVWRGTGAK